MASRTIELRTLVDSGFNIFNFPYPFYDNGKRRDFERKFIEHFYFREIGCETPERFRWYLRDKMQTVFPYYNELLKTSLIDYNILDNYNITEEYTIERENKGKTHGVSSTVGQAFDKQNSEGTQTASGEGTVTTENERSHNASETVHSEGSEKVSGSTKQNETVSEATNSDTTGRTSNVKKFLDTPQGALNLDEIDYLTNLTQDSGTSETHTTSEGEKTTDGSITNSSDKTDETDTTRTASGGDSENGSSKSTDSTSGTTTSVFEGEQRTTHDNNTRTEMIGNQTEKSVYTKKGNIGVDTDADMIQKHIKLQQILRRIELMFFDECEDLFMMVY